PAGRGARSMPAMLVRSPPRKRLIRSSSPSAASISSGGTRGSSMISGSLDRTRKSGMRCSLDIDTDIAPRASIEVDDSSFDGETGTEGESDQSALASPRELPFDHEENRRARHVAVVAKDGTG